MTRIYQPSRYVHRLGIAGFKSIEKKQSVFFRPLTLLAGANSSGKSSIMQPLLLLKQTLEARYDAGPVLLNGPHVSFTSAEQILSLRADGTRGSEFTIELELENGDFFAETFSSDPVRGITIIEAVYSTDEWAYKLHPGMSEEDIRALMPPESPRFMKPYLSASNPDIKWIVERERCFLDLAIESPGWRLLPNGAYGWVDTIVSDLLHIPGLRGNPTRTYPRTVIDEDFLPDGVFGEYVASFVHYWQEARDQRIMSLNEMLQLLGMNQNIEARAIDDSAIELKVNRASSIIGPPKAEVSVADVGFGVSQVLPILVALLVAKPGQLVYIEQPELHLHPRAQVALAQVLADAAMRGVRVVAETHSSLLLLGVQTLVAEGKLSPDLVKLHWFQRRPDDGSTEIISTDLDESGAFETDWPEDFAEVAMQAESRYLDAAEARRLQARR